MHYTGRGTRRKHLRCCRWRFCNQKECRNQRERSLNKKERQHLQCRYFVKIERGQITGDEILIQNSEAIQKYQYTCVVAENCAVVLKTTKTQIQLKLPKDFQQFLIFNANRKLKSRILQIENIVKFEEELIDQKNTLKTQLLGYVSVPKSKNDLADNKMLFSFSSTSIFSKQFKRLLNFR